VCLVRVRPPACTGEGGVHPTTIRLERHMRKSGLELFERSKRRWKLQNTIIPLALQSKSSTSYEITTNRKLNSHCDVNLMLSMVTREHRCSFKI
jgi:hypothetical protein